MTPEEEKYFEDRIDAKVAEAINALTPQQQMAAGANTFADRYMKLITGQEYLPQGVFRQFLKTVDFSNVEAAIEAADAATAAVGALTIKLQETQQDLADIVERIGTFSAALQALRENIAEMEEKIPELFPYREHEMSDAIDNYDRVYKVNMTDLGVVEVMLRTSNEDREKGTELPRFAWTTEDSRMLVYTFAELPEVADNVFNQNGFVVGIVDSVEEPQPDAE